MSTGSYLVRRAIYQNLHIDDLEASKAAAQSNRIDIQNSAVCNSIVQMIIPEAASRMDSDSADPEADTAPSV